MTTDEILRIMHKMTHDALTGTLQVSTVRGHTTVPEEDITALHEAMDIIKERPRNHGHWYQRYVCDDCGAIQKTMTKYCPCCGREMEVPDVGVSD